MGKDQLVLGGQGVELVGGGAEGLAGEDGQRLGGGLVEARRGVQPGADGRAAEGQLPQLGQRPIQRGLVSPQLEQT